MRSSFRGILTVFEAIGRLIRLSSNRIRKTYLSLVAHDLYRLSVATQIIEKVATVATECDRRKSQRTDELIHQLKELGLADDELQSRVLAVLDSEFARSETVSSIVHSLLEFSQKEPDEETVNSN